MIYFVFTLPLFLAPAYSFKFIVFSIIYGFNTWFWLIALWGLSRKHLSHTNGFLHYFNRSAYPIYIIRSYYCVLWADKKNEDHTVPVRDEGMIETCIMSIISGEQNMKKVLLLISSVRLGFCVCMMVVLNWRVMCIRWIPIAISRLVLDINS